jgi:hypothetical protein
MRKLGNRIVAPLLGLMLALSLAFGVGSAFAQVSEPDCPLDVGQGYIGVACQTNAACQAPCAIEYPQGGGGFCNRNGCCECAF